MTYVSCSKASTGDCIEVLERNDDGSDHRRCIQPTADVSAEHAEIQALAATQFTAEVRTAWTTLTAVS